MRLTTWTSAAVLLFVSATMAQEALDPAIQEAMAKRQVTLGTGATSSPPSPTQTPTTPTTQPSPSPDPPTSSPPPPSSSSPDVPSSSTPPMSSAPPSSSNAPPSSSRSPSPSPSSSAPPQSTTYTSALVTSIPTQFTTTIVTVDDSGITRASTLVSSTLSASTTGFATITSAPVVNSGDNSPGSSGLSQNSKNIIGGVVGGVGGAILLGGIAIVAWRLWGKRREKWDEDEVWTTGRAEGEGGLAQKPESSAATTVTAQSGKTNPAANF